MTQHSLYGEKDNSYFQIARYELIKQIPIDAKKILDVGCGQGDTGDAIKKTLTVDEVVGIELVEAAANIAMTKLDKVIIGDVENVELDFSKGYFNCILFADVLEHTKDPWSVLKKFRYFLHDNGAIIISLPNLRHIVPLLKIIFNRFDYEQSGILDKTHLRFFTFFTIKNMLSNCGYQVVDVKTNSSNTVKFKLMRLLSLGLLKDFTVYQYIIKAAKQNIKRL